MLSAALRGASAALGVGSVASVIVGLLTASVPAAVLFGVAAIAILFGLVGAVWTYSCRPHGKHGSIR